MVSFPNAKINLGLRVTGQRVDGFHDIETIFYPVALHDAVEIIKDKKTSFNTVGIAIGGPAGNNLCLQAFNLLKQDHPSLPDVAIYLLKNIPVGAGLGGGSADAVACLQMLNSIANLDLTEKKISEYALLLGSDCPFFVMNKPCIARGRGELLQEVQLDLSAYHLLIVNPGIHVNTGWAFSALAGYSAVGNLEDVITQPITAWRELLQNDFERVVNKKHPETLVLKELMYANGALYASLSGTGSTVYGLFEKNSRPDLQLPGSYFVKWL